MKKISDFTLSEKMQRMDRLSREQQGRVYGGNSSDAANAPLAPPSMPSITMTDPYLPPTITYSPPPTVTVSLPIGVDDGGIYGRITF